LAHFFAFGPGSGERMVGTIVSRLIAFGMTGAPPDQMSRHGEHSQFIGYAPAKVNQRCWERNSFAEM
jgi:hypothetical protein